MPCRWFFIFAISTTLRQRRRGRAPVTGPGGKDRRKIAAHKKRAGLSRSFRCFLSHCDAVTRFVHLSFMLKSASSEMT
jgi:hypothetical protein